MNRLASLGYSTDSRNSLSCKISSVSLEELVLRHLIRCELSRLRCHGHSLLLSSYLCRITEGEFFIQRLRTPSTGSNSPPPGLSRIRASPARHLWHFFYFKPLVQTLGRSPILGSQWSSSTPPSLGRGRVAPPQHWCIIWQQPFSYITVIVFHPFVMLSVKQGSYETFNVLWYDSKSESNPNTGLDHGIEPTAGQRL